MGVARAAAIRHNEDATRSVTWATGHSVGEAQYHDLESYRRYVAAVADAQPNFGDKVLVTRQDPHVSIVIAKIFDLCERRVCILTRRLKPPVYGSDEVIEAARKFLTDYPAAQIC